MNETLDQTCLDIYEKKTAGGISVYYQHSYQYEADANVWGYHSHVYELLRLKILYI